MKKYFATLDIGTSKIKGMIWDINGQCHYYYCYNSPPLQLNDLFVEQDIKLFAQQILLLFKKLDSFVSFKQCACLAISTQRNTFVAMDKNNELTDLVSWLDTRGNYVNGDRFDWFRKNFSAFKKISAIRSLMSWLVEKLTGLACETASTAPYEWLVSRPKFSTINGPELITHGTSLAAKSNDSRIRRIIPDGLPIVIAAGDKDCSLLGGQAHLPFRAVVCSGTAISMGRLIQTNKNIPKKNNIYYSPTNFVNHEPIETGLPYAAGLMSYLKDCHHIDIHAVQCELPDIASPIFCLPAFFSDHFNFNADPKFVGLDKPFTQANIASAALEGIILELRHCKLTLQSVDENINEIILGGNNFWLVQHAQWLADALQCEIKLMKNLELTSNGLAMTAMTCIEKKQNYFSAADKFRSEENVMTLFQPNKKFSHHWNERFQIYNLHRQI